MRAADDLWLALQDVVRMVEDAPKPWGEVIKFLFMVWICVAMAMILWYGAVFMVWIL